MFTYLMSKDELKDLAPHIVGWSDGKFHLHHKTSSDRIALEYKSLEAGSEAWLEIPIVTGATESGRSWSWVVSNNVWPKSTMLLNKKMVGRMWRLSFERELGVRRSRRTH
jgi:hypothetical protein